VKWRTKKDEALAPSQRPLPEENKANPARRRIDARLRDMPTLFKVCMDPIQTCYTDGHFHERDGSAPLNEGEARGLLNPPGLDLDDGAELVPYPTGTHSNVSVAPQSSAQADDSLAPQGAAPVVDFTLGSALDFPEISTKRVQQPAPQATGPVVVVQAAVPAKAPKSPKTADAAVAAADQRVECAQDNGAEEKDEDIVAHVACAPSAPPFEDLVAAPLEEHKLDDAAEPPAVDPPSGGGGPGEEAEDPDLARTTVLLYITGGAYSRYAKGWKEWFLEKLPLLTASKDAIYQRVRDDMVTEVADVKSIVESNFHLDVFGWWKSSSYGHFHPGAGLHWLLRYYDSVYLAQVYMEMYDALRKIDAWNTSMQLGLNGVHTTIHSFLYNLLKQEHPARLGEWSKNECVFNNTMNYCVNRYVVVHGTRLATAPPAKVDFRFGGALRATSPNAPFFAGP
jgi:hypothetical protein